MEESWRSSGVKYTRQREGLKIKGKEVFPGKHSEHQCGTDPRSGLEGCLLGRANVALLTKQPGKKPKGQRYLEKGHV